MSTPATKKRRGNRRQEILETLVRMLEKENGGRITTANLAAKIGVSEAALYRHFPSKAKMYDGLLDFVEESLFSRINSILNSEASALDRCPRIIHLVLAFAESNAGLCRLLAGDALMGEDQRLQQRVNQIFARLETTIKQVLREAELQESLRTPFGLGATVNMLTLYLDGKILQYVRSGFEKKPTENWEDQWTAMSKSLFRISVAS
ncbi:MAG: nucleoid occlusion factor SlmA [Porticoccaceae bacterium]|jgi:TetR/AcrR family transcriptional regulator|nr:nucleoid occlusion factor SlmA [Porticoccaceae bacterium]